MLWPEWALRLTVPTSSIAYMRASLAAAVLLIGTRLRFGAAGDLRGSGMATRQQTTRILQFLADDPHWNGSLTALTRLGDYLATTEIPIDYAWRRQLDYTGLLPDDEWSRLCRITATPRGCHYKADFARCLLSEPISGLPAECSPFFQSGNRFRGKQPGFVRDLTPNSQTNSIGPPASISTAMT